MWNYCLAKVPLKSLCPAFCFLLPLLFLLPIVHFPLVSWCLLSKQPLIAFCHRFCGGFRGCSRGFSSSLIRTPLLRTTPMSGGCHKANLVQIATKPPLVPPALNKLNQSFLAEEVQVTLYCPG